jgi:hypothetical protein
MVDGMKAAGLLLVLLVLLGPSTLRAQAFEEVSRSVGIDHFVYDPHRIAGGVAFFDYNNDGWLDIYLTGGRRRDRLYENRGNGKFRDRTKEAGLNFTDDLETVGVVTGDIDNDGDRDLFLTTGEHDVNYLLLNNGDGTFSDISEQAGISQVAVWGGAAAFGDYDLDGDLDLYVANYATYSAIPYDENLTGGIPNFLYRNNGDNTFDEVAVSLGVENPNGLTLGVAFSDYDTDGDVDLWVANDFGYLFEPNALFRNEYPEDHFTDVSQASGTAAPMNGMGIGIGDYDNDGDLDYYIGNIQESVFFENRGDGSFGDVAIPKGINLRLSTSWGIGFLDYDHDTDFDLFIANGRVMPRYNLASAEDLQRMMQPHVDRLYRNSGFGTFYDVSKLEGIADSSRGRGVAYGDYDNDGDLDLVVNVLSIEERTSLYSKLYRNDGTGDTHWLQVSLQGTTSNRDAYGSRVRIVAGGQSRIREIHGGSSYASQHTSIAHFGLADITRVDSLIVTWPGGARETFTDLVVDQVVYIVEGAGITR